MGQDDPQDRPRITKLTGLNHRVWSVQIRNLLRGKGLWGAIEPGYDSDEESDSEPAPKEDSPPEPKASTETGTPGEAKVVLTPKEKRKAQRVKRRDEKAMGYIMDHCAAEPLERILLLKTALEMWNSLQEMYARKGPQQLNAKLNVFYTYAPPPATSVYSVKTILDRLQTEIGSADPTLRPADQVKTIRLLTIMKSRGARYDAIVTQIEMAEITDYDRIVTKFANFEDGNTESKSVVESALRAEANDSEKAGRDPKRGGDQRKCFHCNKAGHIKADCRSRKRGDPKAGGASTGPLIAPGGGEGLSPQPTEEAKVAEVTATSWIAIAGAESCGTANWASDGGAQGRSWIVDSGCSRHMTYDEQSFISYRLLDEPIPVNTASGATIEAIAEGTVSFNTLVQGEKRQIQLHGVLHVPRLAGSLISVPHLQDRGIMTRTVKSGRMLLESSRKRA
jgi:hypothetical protein